MSSEFSTLEKRLASFLASFPVIKQFVKKIYARINLILYKKSYNKKTKFQLTHFRKPGYESFFGYYDKSPMNQNGFVLSHLSSLSTYKKPDPNLPLQIALFHSDKPDSPIFTIPTAAYNWQQGTRLQWLNENLFIFNDFDEVGKIYISRVYSPEKNEEVQRFPLPVQDAYKTDYFMSINYRRIQSLRPDYGYRNLPALNKKELKNLKNDGIWKVDYRTGDSQLLINLQMIVNTDFKSSYSDAMHYVNHVMISPNGDYFIFLHRYFIKGKRYDRLLVSDCEGKELSVLTDYDMVSHCTWIDNDTILGYLNNINKQPGLYKINIHNKSFQHIARGDRNKEGDGHPSLKGNWFVYDSYPDKARIQHLTMNNLSGETVEIGEFYHSLKFNGETRCDLHPRFSPNGKKIFIDTVYSGKRELAAIDILPL